MTDLAQLVEAAQPLELIKRPVRLAGATVHQVLGDGFLLLRTSTERGFLVWTTESLGEVRAGDKIDLTGRIAAVPPGAAEMGLDSNLTRALAAQPICIYAVQLRKSETR